MFGIALNAVGILVGGALGAAGKKVAPENESILKLVLGVLTTFIGLRLVWLNLSGSFGNVVKQLSIVIFAMMLGKLLGRFLRLQKISNSIGRYASDKLAKLKPGTRGHPADGFKVGTGLFCAAPLAVLASVHESFSGFSSAFIVKAAMDGLAAMSFMTVFGWSVLLAVIPVVAYQGTIFLCVRLLAPWLETHDLVEPLLATNGLLIFCVALVILGLKKIELADYLPSLAMAPLIAYYWR